MSETMSTQMPGRMATIMPNRMSESRLNFSARKSDRMSGYMPERMADRMSYVSKKIYKPNIKPNDTQETMSE